MNHSRIAPPQNRFPGFVLVLSGLVGLVGLSACGSSGDDDDPSDLTITTPIVDEGDSGTTVMTFDVTLSEAATETVALNYATSDDTATVGTDYVAGNGTITIPAGSVTASFDITINGDTDIEADETLVVTLDGVQGVSLTQTSYTVQGTIDNDDHVNPSGYYTGTASVKMVDNSTALEISDLQVLVNDTRIMAMGLLTDPDNFVLYDITINNFIGDSYTGDVIIYKAGGFLATTTVSGTITKGTSLEGSFAGAGIGNGSFSVSYDSVVNAKVAELSVIANTRYDGSLNTGFSSFKFDIDTTGNVISTLSSINAIKFSGCNIVTGSSLRAIAGQNLYDLIFVLSGCDDATVNGSYSGLITLTDDTILPLANRFMPTAFSNGSFAGTAVFNKN